MAGILVDANVRLDILTADPLWLARSSAELRQAKAGGEMLVNPMICAEIAPALDFDWARIEAWLARAGIRTETLPFAASVVAPAGSGAARACVATPGFLHRCARRSGRAHAAHARCGAVSHLFSKGAAHLPGIAGPVKNMSAARWAAPTTLLTPRLRGSCARRRWGDCRGRRARAGSRRRP